MKLIAVIGIFAFLLTGLESLYPQPIHEATVQICCCDENTCSEEGCSDEEGEDEDQERKNSCEEDCNCSSSFSPNWIALDLSPAQPSTGIDYFFTEYRNEYRFEFQSPLLQPPRLV